MRRSQAVTRTAIPFAEADATLGLIKINPLADWSLAQVEADIARHDIPVNALHARGFPSIGCQPCTRAIKPGEDIRAGRWWWENEDGKECGLHNRPKHVTSPI
jgi:phosphoadenosine phosphosulfate reductase